MASTLAAKFTSKVDTTYSKPVETWAIPTESLSVQHQDSYSNGTGANQCDKEFHDERTLAAGTPEELDLAGALTNGFGETVTFAKIKSIWIEFLTETAGYTLEVGGAALNAFATMFGDATDKLVIGAGGHFYNSSPIDGFAVTAATADLLKINNPNAGEITYKIILTGTSA